MRFLSGNIKISKILIKAVYKNVYENVDVEYLNTNRFFTT